MEQVTTSVMYSVHFCHRCQFAYSGTSGVGEYVGLGYYFKDQVFDAAASWANIIFGAYSGVRRRALSDLLLNLTVTLKALTEMVPHDWPVHMQIKNYDFTKPGFNATTAAFTWVSL